MLFYYRECEWRVVSYRYQKITIFWSICNLRLLPRNSITIYLPSNLHNPRCRSIRFPRLLRRWRRGLVLRYPIRHPKWRWRRIRYRRKYHMYKNTYPVQRSRERWNRRKRSTPKKHGPGKNRYQRFLYNRKNYRSYSHNIVLSLFDRAALFAVHSL